MTEASRRLYDRSIAEHMEHDGDEWRAIRNRLLAEWVQDADAIRWLLDLWDAYEVVDDLIDRDKPVGEDRIFRMLWEFAIDCPSNPFFLRNVQTLIPILHMGVNHWIDSVHLEREGSDKSLHLSFVLRDAYMSILQAVIELTRGRAVMRAISLDVFNFFGEESFDAYREKLAKSEIERRAGTVNPDGTVNTLGLTGG